MRVLVDTCVWSLVLRRRDPDPILTEKLKDLIADGRAEIIGPIRQELLSGISDPRRFNRMKDRLAAFKDIPLRTEHFVLAAEFSNTCRKGGIQGTTIDFLICAVAALENLAVFTTDRDFAKYQKRLPIRLLD